MGAQLRPHHLQQKLEMLHDLGGVRRGRRHEKMLLGKARGRAVIHYDAIFAQHQAVADATDWQRLEIIAVDTIEELGSVRTLNVYFSERRDVNETNIVADCQCLPDDRLIHGLAGTWIGARAKPQSGLHPGGARRLVPIVHCRAADRLEMASDIATGEGGQRHWRVWRSEGGCADRRDCLATQVSEQGQSGDVARLALVGPHAESRIAL
jgi:hypothetical protein